MRILWITLAAVVASCNSAATREPTEVGAESPALAEAPVGEPFTLAIGEQTRVPAADLTVRLVDVPSDSRCPADVACVWAGDAVVVVETVHAGLEQRRVLHTPTEQVGPAAVAVDGHVLRLLALAPEPRSGHPVPAEEYRATLVVEPAPD